MRLQQLSAIVQTASRRVRAAVDGGQPELAHIRRMMVERVLDCEHRQVMRVKKLVDDAQTVQDLWLLRSEVYQVVSQQHGQFTAQQRVASLWPLFEGWVPRETLRAV